MEEEIAKQIGYFKSQKTVTEEPFHSTAIPRHIYDRIDYIQSLATSEASSLEKEGITTESYNEGDLVQNLETSSDASDLKAASSTELPVSEASLQDQIVQTTEQTVASTTAAPDKTEVVKPKHIYDQIDLLNASEEGQSNFVNDKANTQKLTQDFNQISNQNNNNIPENQKQLSPHPLYQSNLNQISNQNYAPNNQEEKSPIFLYEENLNQDSNQNNIPDDQEQKSPILLYEENLNQNSDQNNTPDDQEQKSPILLYEENLNQNSNENNKPDNQEQKTPILLYEENLNQNNIPENQKQKAPLLLYDLNLNQIPYQNNIPDNRQQKSPILLQAANLNQNPNQNSIPNNLEQKAPLLLYNLNLNQIPNQNNLPNNRQQTLPIPLYKSNLNQVLNQNNIRSDNRQQKSLNLLYEPNLNKENLTNINSINSQPINVMPTSVGQPLPETAALRILLKRRRRPHRPYQIFDVTKFLPTPLPPPILTYSASTVLPKYKTLSEVYYKDEIQPNEQLNVFADVINNIKNSPQEPLSAESSEYVPTIQDSWNAVNTQRSVGKKIKVPPRKIRIKHNDSASSYSTIDNIYKTTSTTTTTTTTTTTAAPRKRRRNKYKNHKPDPQVYEEYLQTVKENAEDFSKLNSKEPETSQTVHSYKKNKQPEITNLKDSYFAEGGSFYNPILNQEIPTGVVLDDVIGLSPPAPVTLSEASTLNTYVVSGMKPPSIGKPYVYSTFRLPQTRIRRKNYYHRIHKRSPVKPSYSEIRRNKPAQSSSESKEEKKEEEEEEEEEEDDYVPKRNRNFHYDVENHRVVYLNKKEEEKEEIVPETQQEEEEEDGVEYLTLTKPEPKPQFVVITTERNGPSFLDYIQQLKSNSNYRVILDPVKTKKPSEKPTEKADLKEMESTTSKQVKTAVPEFLSIVSKLKSAEGYTEIKEKKEKSTTTAAPEEEEEVEAEVEEVGNVQNSPGAAQDSNGFDRMQIFDISEYLPQPKNYSPRTVIDYSKYKTIQRAPVATRHNLSSRYNSEDDELPLRHRDTTQTPILATSEDNIKSGSSEEEVIGNKGIRENNRRNSYSSSEELAEEDVEKSTTQFAEITTTRPTRRRNRKRPTTTTTTPSPTEPTTTLRKRTRTRSRPTTTAETLLEENYSHTQRVVQRRRIPAERVIRQDRKIPSNHKAFYTPIVMNESEGQPKVTVVPVAQRKRKVSRIVPPQQIQLPTNATEKSKMSDKTGEVESGKLVQVQVFQKYDPNKKHGGNYRREEEKKVKEEEDDEEDSSAQAVEVNSVAPIARKKVERLTDVVPKPYAFYSDPTLPKNVNQLKEPKAAESLPSDSEENEFPPNMRHAMEKDYSDESQEEVKINFNKNSETVPSKPVNFVKDPSKRLYFYAPVK
ncbi:hypothetical protein ILUMI_20293 [Ignelater luminosus]|uniref:Uncharacterized protein n=1 Tax=Ignelater luminosus TaxID=2038154 RepID=A0A8K0CL68_IGNLU|nr:hypothetical protein ILUMI_20293 [Ignelater luminosus]